MILLIAFGSLVAAGVPLLLALSAVLATFGLVALPSQVFPIDDAAASVVLLIGMAVGVDYSLFYMRREREERAAGTTRRPRSQRAAETSGRAVLVSGLTVMAAMAGMFLSGDKGVRRHRPRRDAGRRRRDARLADGPAGDARLARRPGREGPRAVRAAPARGAPASRGSGARSSTRSCAARSSRAVAATAVLVALAMPGARHEDRRSRASPTSRRTCAVMKTYDRIDKAFPGENVPARSSSSRTTTSRSGEGRRGDRRAEAQGRRDRPDVRPDHDHLQQGRHGRRDRDPDGRRRRQRRVEGSALDAARRHHPGDGRQCLRARRRTSPA